MHIFSPVLPGEGCSWWEAIFYCCTLTVTVPTLHVSGVNSRRNSLAGWSLYKENHKMWWKRAEYRTFLGIVVVQLISVLKCLQGKDNVLLYWWDVLLNWKEFRPSHSQHCNKCLPAREIALPDLDADYKNYTQHTTVAMKQIYNYI